MQPSDIAGTDAAGAHAHRLSTATAGTPRAVLGQPLISCAGAGRTFGARGRPVVALYDTTCTIVADDRIAITGPSGSGKSTLLHLLAGLEEPTVGTVTWPALDRRPHDPGHVGLVFQAPTLIPSLTVAENVRLPLLLAGHTTATATARAAAALDLLQLEPLGLDLPQQLSGGQAQRVVIARVLASQPLAILADEPTSQLDRATADHVMDVLLQAADEAGAALVVATHDQSVAGRMAQNWPISDGRLLADEPVPSLTRPRPTAFGLDDWRTGS